jgi:hypothetical protein
MEPIQELQKIYDADIRFSISTFLNGGFTIKVGNYCNMLEAESVVATLDEAVSWLQGQIQARYPDSIYARQLLLN